MLSNDTEFDIKKGGSESSQGHEPALTFRAPAASPRFRMKEQTRMEVSLINPTLCLSHYESAARSGTSLRTRQWKWSHIVLTVMGWGSAVSRSGRGEESRKAYVCVSARYMQGVQDGPKTTSG